ncbi:hypothetical protein WJX79_009463 [Trebouxia sp. C0005]
MANPSHFPSSRLSQPQSVLDDLLDDDFTPEELSSCCRLRGSYGSLQPFERQPGIVHVQARNVLQIIPPHQCSKCSPRAFLLRAAFSLPGLKVKPSVLGQTDMSHTAVTMKEYQRHRASLQHQQNNSRTD